MIVNVTNEGLEIITHYAHGLQAGQLAQQLSKEIRPPYWVKTLCAIIEHDDEQINFERNNNLTDSGLPAHFELVKSSPADILERCERIVERSRHRSGWVTLLILEHLDFIYQDLVKEDKPLRDFLQSFDKLKKQLRRTYKVNKSDMNSYYEVLRFCDRLSLIISQNLVPGAGRMLEINKSINNQTYFIKSKRDGFTVEPWIFEQDSFEISTEVVNLEKLVYKSNDELEQHLLDKQSSLKSYCFYK